MAKFFTSKKKIYFYLMLILLVAASVIGWNKIRFGSNISCKSEYDVKLSNKPLYQVTVSLSELSLSTGKVIPHNTLEIYNLKPNGAIDEKPIVCPVTDEGGKARFKLPAGAYRVMAAGSFVGSSDFSVHDGINISLKVQMISE